MKQVIITSPRVGVCMGSTSDLGTMRAATEILSAFEVPCETRIVSAHRTPEHLFEYAKTARGRGLEVIIAGAGGAAHLPGMVAALTTLPVIGVPVQNGALQGSDALLSIVQMPKGCPVATVAIGQATNAAYLALRMLAITDTRLADALESFHRNTAAKVREQDAQVQAEATPVALP